MAEVAAGGGEVLTVHRDALRQSADQARQISDAVGRLAGAVSPACSPAAEAHAGWRFGRALAALVPSWECQLRQQSAAVAAAAGKLASSEANYSAAEANLVAHAEAIFG